MAKITTVIAVTFRDHVEIPPVGGMRGVSLNQGEYKLQVHDDPKARIVTITSLDERLSGRSVRIPYENVASIKTVTVDVPDDELPAPEPVKRGAKK